MAIVDTNNMMSAPKGLTRASGIDVMTHAIEAYVSMMASDYTDGLALKAIKLVFEYLPRAYKDGNDVEARDHMANASCMAGLAFANAFLGVNHSRSQARCFPPPATRYRKRSCSSGCYALQQC